MNCSYCGVSHLKEPLVQAPGFQLCKSCLKALLMAMILKDPDFRGEVSNELKKSD